MSRTPCYSFVNSWSGSGAAAEEPGVKRDKEELEQRFASLRPEVLETLSEPRKPEIEIILTLKSGRCGHENSAFKLAEKYRDFSSLAALCNRDVVYPPEQNPHAKRIQTYIDRFHDDFTRELYQWYIQHGELRVMFSYDDEKGYIDSFLAERPNPSVSWVHDIGKQRFDDASNVLLHEARGAVNLESKHVSEAQTNTLFFPLRFYSCRLC